MARRPVRLVVAVALAANLGLAPVASGEPFAPASVAEGFAAVEEALDASPQSTITSQDQYLDFQRSKYVKAGDMLDALLDMRPTTAERQKLVRQKIIVLANLSSFEVAGARAKYVAFVDEIAADPQPEIAFVGKRFVLSRQISHALEQSDDERDRIFRDAQDYVFESEPTEDTLSIASQLSHTFMKLRDLTPAVGLNDAFAAHFEKSADAELKEAAESFRHTADRARLPGQEITIVGKTLAGDEFDLKQFSGRVVLVDFFAYGCPHCHDEAPLLRRKYRRYHPLGFEIVSIGLFDSPDVVQRFADKYRFTWPVIADADKDNSRKNPNADRYGITGIPTCILVGRDGKVLSIHARGEELNRLLLEQFPRRAEAEHDADNIRPTTVAN